MNGRCVAVSTGPQHHDTHEMGSSDMSVAMCRRLLKATTSYIWTH